MDPETENLVDEAVKARLRWMAADEQAAVLKQDYKAKLKQAVDVGVRGVKAEIARRAGVSDETIRLDSNETARRERIAARTKTTP